jgi:hypothetical protein
VAKKEGHEQFLLCSNRGQKQGSVERHVVYLTEKFVRGSCDRSRMRNGCNEARAVTKRVRSAQGGAGGSVQPWLRASEATAGRGVRWRGERPSRAASGSRKEPSRPRLSYRLRPMDESATNRTVNITLMTSNDETSAVYLHDPTRQSTTALASSSRAHSYTSLTKDELSSPLP